MTEKKMFVVKFDLVERRTGEIIETNTVEVFAETRQEATRTAKEIYANFVGRVDIKYCLEITSQD